MDNKTIYVFGSYMVTVEKRLHDYIAYVNNDKTTWECDVSVQEAVSKLLVSLRVRDNIHFYLGICPNSSGFFNAQEIYVSATNVTDALGKIRQQITGSRYVSRIIKIPEKVTVWEEGKS